MQFARTLRACVIMLVFLSQSADAQLFGRIFEDEEWTEQQARLPAFPKSENLVQIQIDAVKTFEFRIDAISIDIGQDGVIRYVIVARSTSGSENISFEGIRCKTRERKLYAIGRPDRSWAQARNSKWTKYGSGNGGYQLELASNFFCPNTASVRTAAEAVANLKRGGIAREPVNTDGD